MVSLGMQHATPFAAESSASVVVTRAVLRVAAALHVSQKELSSILGLSEATVSRLTSGKATLDVERKEGELALLFVRVYRSLDALVGGEEKARAWFQAPNTHLGGVPAERVRTVEGLVHVSEYLDAMRGQL